MLMMGNHTNGEGMVRCDAPSVDGSESLPAVQQQVQGKPKGGPSAKKPAGGEKGHTHQLISPKRRDHDIEEFQKRRITIEDFMQGAPRMELAFSKHVRKFNRELLKATCQVIGCKPQNAYSISEKVFDEFNVILNNLTENVDFKEHFHISEEIVDNDTTS